MTPSTDRTETDEPCRVRDNVYAQLGVRTIINALGTVTRLGGSIMPPEVVQAMQHAGGHFVSMSELHERVGQRIAALIGVEAATVTTGAAGAITMGTAACVTQGDPQKARQLPNTRGMRNEVIVQKSHLSYKPQIHLVGATIVEIETPEQLEAAIGPKTAMLFFVNTRDPNGQINREAWVAAGKRHSVPTLNDAAADIPPPHRLSEYVHMGFDLVAFSGGKGLLGPQCTGLLLGRKDLVEAARAHGSVWGGIGRGMKIGKEEVVGLLAAVERFMKLNHDSERQMLESRLRTVSEVLSDIPGLRTEVYMPEIANNVPHLNVEWNTQTITLSAQEVSNQLIQGDPAIEVGGHNWFRPNRKVASHWQGITVSVWMLRPGEPQIVARRLRDILTAV